MRAALAAAAAVVAALTACADGPTPAAQPASAPTTSVSRGPTAVAGSPADPVVVRYRIERRTSDPETADFAIVVATTLADPRGWLRAGFRLVEDPEARYRIVLAEGLEVDALCLPYDTYGQFSCQNGPVVAINADRWRSAHPKWTGTVPDYRQMVVNHEVGHLLGMHHPDVPCPAAGEPAPVMAQQSTELDGCLPSPWPLEHEIERAARHDLPLAPAFGQ